jgi:hypothetical protein
MKSQRIVSFVLVALAIGFVSIASPIFAQSSSSAPDVTGPEPPKVLARPETSPSARDGGAAPKAAATMAYYRVAGAAFQPRNSGTTYASTGGGGGIHSIARDSDSVFHAPVYFPQGTLIDGLRMYFYRFDTTTSCQGWLTVYNRQTGGIVQEFLVVPGSWYGYNWNDANPFSLTIDNSQYIYVLNWRPLDDGTNMVLESFGIFHYPPAPAAKVVVVPLF